MNRTRIPLLMIGTIILALALLAVGYRVYAMYATRPEATDLTPEGVVTRFYSWYLDECAYDPDSGTRGNPLVDGTYRESAHLAPQFIQGVEETLASFELMMSQGQPGGADPILWAQDVPARIVVRPAAHSGETATVVAQFLWEDGTPAFDRLVTLRRQDGVWKIAGVSFTEDRAGSGASPAPGQEEAAPPGELEAAVGHVLASAQFVECARSQ